MDSYFEVISTNIDQSFKLAPAAETAFFSAHLETQHGSMTAAAIRSPYRPILTLVIELCAPLPAKLTKMLTL